MDRAVIIGNPSSGISTLLGEAALRASGPSVGIEFVAICDGASSSTAPYFVRRAREAVLRAAIEFFDPSRRGTRHNAGNLHGVARRFSLPVLVPPQRNVNHPDFIRHLRDDLGVTVVLSLGCIQIYRPDFIAAFPVVVNLHTGQVPAYRGLRTTEWSIYRGESSTGFTFHYVTPGIDEGHILVRGDVPIPAGASHAEIEREKFKAAAARVPELLAKIVRREAGERQVGDAGYFAGKDFLRARNIGDPALRNKDQLLLALRCFDILHLQLGSQLLPVTKLEPARTGADEPFSFVTRDGSALKATRFAYFPYPLYKLAKSLRLAA